MVFKLWPIICFQLDSFHHECSIFVVFIGCSCFLPCSSLQFSLFPVRPYSSCVSPQVFPFLFCKHRKILHKLDDLVVNFHLEFPSSNLPPSGPGPFHSIWYMFVVLYGLPFGVHIFGFWSTSGALGCTAWLSQDNHLLGIMGPVKCQDVSVSLDSFFAFSNGDSSYICYCLFSQGWCYLLCCQCQLPTPDNSYGSIASFMRVGPAFYQMKDFHF